VQAADGGNDIWICDVARGTLTRVTFDPGEDETPVWSPDGTRLAWVTQRSDKPRQVMRRRADGSGEEEVVWSTDRHAHLHDWSPDGAALLATQEAESSARDIWLVPVAGGEGRPLLKGPFEECNPRFSPDGPVGLHRRVGALRGVRLRVPVDRRAWASSARSAGGLRAGRSLPRRGQPRDERAPPRAGPPNVARGPCCRPLRAATGRTSHVDYDVHPDGTRFVMVGTQAAGTSADLGVIVGWFEELRQLPPQVH
jgi:hypothetical protein